MKIFILEILAFACIISSILVITSRNPVIAVIYLISVFINAACYLLMLGLGFIGLTYLLLYVGAITILFLFVIMSINIKLTDIMEAGSQYTQNIPLAISIGILFIYELFSILPNSIYNLGLHNGANPSLFNYPIKAFKWINDQLLNISQMDSGSYFSESKNMWVNHIYANEDNLIDKELDYDNLKKIIEDVANSEYASSTNTKTLLSEANINIEGLVENLNELPTIESSTLSITQSYTEQIDSNLSNLIQLSSLGQELYTHGVSWLIICGMILLLSLLCPTIITRSPKQDS